MPLINICPIIYSLGKSPLLPGVFPCLQPKLQPQLSTTSWVTFCTTIFSFLHVPWLSWLRRPTVISSHRKIESSSLSGTVCCNAFVCVWLCMAFSSTLYPATNKKYIRKSRRRKYVNSWGCPTFCVCRSLNCSTECSAPEILIKPTSSDNVTYLLSRIRC